MGAAGHGTAGEARIGQDWTGSERQAWTGSAGQGAAGNGGVKPRFPGPLQVRENPLRLRFRDERAAKQLK